MEKRKAILGGYDTALDGLWTLNSCTLSDPVVQTHLVDVPGRDGPLDLSTALTDGEPRYGSRTLTIRLESSEGTRMEREDRIDALVNRLDGWRTDAVLPDRPQLYLEGRFSVAREYNDMAHAAVVVTAVCDPWRYFKNARAYTLKATADEQTVVLSNVGRRTAVPQLTVTGTVSLTFGGNTWTLTDGTYQLPDLALRSGNTQLTYSGSGTAVLTYREAVL